MSLERSSSSIDLNWIRENETHEFKIQYFDYEEQEKYQEIVRKLAEAKIILSNGVPNSVFHKMLKDAIKDLLIAGITVSESQLQADIEKETINQQVQNGLDSLEVSINRLNSIIDKRSHSENKKETLPPISIEDFITDVKIAEVWNDMNGDYFNLDKETESKEEHQNLVQQILMFIDPSKLSIETFKDLKQSLEKLLTSDLVALLKKLQVHGISYSSSENKKYL